MAKRLQIKKKPAKSPTKTAGISDEAVKTATGRTWEEWGKLLDKDGCKAMPHKEIAEIVSEKHGVAPWWSQMVTVGYEQSRGLRKPHESCAGWKCSVSRVIDVPVSRLFEAWSDGPSRRKWLGDKDIEIRTATANKSMRITWPDKTSISTNFYAKGAGKSQVVVEHSKLKGGAEIAKAKKFWAATLEKLKETLDVV